MIITNEYKFHTRLIEMLNGDNISSNESYDSLHKSIQDGLDTDEITFIEAVAYDQLVLQNYMTEKKTRFAYRLDKFKKRFNYDGEYITIDGTKFKIDLSEKHLRSLQFYDDVLEVTTPNSISSNSLSDVPIINLNDKYFEIKDPRIRDAILLHEIGHSKLHNISLANKFVPHDIRLMDIFNTRLQEIKGEIRHELRLNYPIATTDDINVETQRFISRIISDPRKYERLILRHNKSDLHKLREEAREYSLSLPTNPSNRHTNADEYEADAYARNFMVNSRPLMRSIDKLDKLLFNKKEFEKRLKIAARFNGTYDVISKLTDSQIEELRKKAREKLREDKAYRKYALDGSDLHFHRFFKEVIEDDRKEHPEAYQNPIKWRVIR